MKPMDHKLIAVAAAALVLLALFPPAPVSGQAVATSCTASLIATFTPCLSFITNSTTDGGASPTADCCRCLGVVVNASLSCTCLILTGHVSLGLTINHTLAVMLPKACNSTTSVSLQCKDTSAQLPAPGPVALAPAMAPLSPMTTESPAPTPEPPVATPAPTPEPTMGTPASSPSQAQTRPQVVPSSAWKGSAGVSLLFAVAGTMHAGLSSIRK